MGGLVQTAEQMQECGLAAAAGAGDGHEAALIQREGHIVQCVDGIFAGLIDLTKVCCFENFHNHSSLWVHHNRRILRVSFFYLTIS